jgi:hypothetical protein
MTREVFTYRRATGQGGRPATAEGRRLRLGSQGRGRFSFRIVSTGQGAWLDHVIARRSEGTCGSIASMAVMAPSTIQVRSYARRAMRTISRVRYGDPDRHELTPTATPGDGAGGDSLQAFGDVGFQIVEQSRGLYFRAGPALSFHTSGSTGQRSNSSPPARMCASLWTQTATAWRKRVPSEQSEKSTALRNAVRTAPDRQALPSRSPLRHGHARDNRLPAPQHFFPQRIRASSAETPERPCGSDDNPHPALSRQRRPDLHIDIRALAQLDW